MSGGGAARRLLPAVVAVGVLALAAAAAFAMASRVAGTAPRAVPLLVALGAGALGLAVALALTAWVFARGLAAGYRTAAGPTPTPPPRARRRPRFAVVGPVLLLAVLGTFGLRWVRYVTNADTPFDAVGIGLNARVPEPLRRWGCARLAATFGASTPPPPGCGAAGDPNRWR